MTVVFDSVFYHIGGRPILGGVFMKIEPGKICGLSGGELRLLELGPPARA